MNAAYRGREDLHYSHDCLTCVGGILSISLALFESRSYLKSLTLVIEVVLS